MIPRSLRRECGNCRHRYRVMTGDQAALYHVCHEGPPVMLSDNDGTLRTWFPIVQDVMFCNHFSYTRGKALLILVAALAIGTALGLGAAHYFDVSVSGSFSVIKPE